MWLYTHSVHTYVYLGCCDNDTSRHACIVWVHICVTWHSLCHAFVSLYSGHCCRILPPLPYAISTVPLLSSRIPVHLLQTSATGACCLRHRTLHQVLGCLYGCLDGTGIAGFNAQLPFRVTFYAMPFVCYWQARRSLTHPPATYCLRIHQFVAAWLYNINHVGHWTVCLPLYHTWHPIVLRLTCT